MEQNSKGFFQILIGFLLAILVVVSAYYYLSLQKPKTQMNSDSKTHSQIAPISIITSSPTPMQVSGQTYKGTSFVYTNNVYSGYTFSFPKSCEQIVGELTCKFTHGSGTIYVNAGGHGGDNIETKVIKSNETKVIPAGDGKITLIEDVKGKTVFGTFWINKTDKLVQEPIFGFEFTKIPVEDVLEFEQLFDQMMLTFSFTN